MQSQSICHLEASSRSWRLYLMKEDHLLNCLSTMAQYFVEMFTKFTEVWGIWLKFWCTYIPLGNGILKRSYCTIKHITIRSECSIIEAVYWYNVILKDDATDSTASANSIHVYQTYIKGIDVAPPCEHKDPGTHKVGDVVCVKTLHHQKEWSQESIAHIPFSSMECHAESKTSAHDRNLLHQKMMPVISHLRATQTCRCFSVLMMMQRMREAKWARVEKRWANPISLYLCDREIREECRRQDNLSHQTKWAGICLACKMSDGLKRKKETWPPWHPNLR